MTEEKIILGVDPGTRITGYGVIRVKGSQIVPIDFGCIRPPINLDPPQKYLIIFNGVEQLMLKYKPVEMAVETQFVYKNVQSALKLGMARGVILLAAARLQIPIFEYAPTKAKLAVVGNGSASKEQVQKMIQLLFRLPHPPEPEDAADALALAICHAHQKPLKREAYV
jgi:crossover junction endodeoxyribonuclease RuvC